MRGRFSCVNAHFLSFHFCFECIVYMHAYMYVTTPNDSPTSCFVIHIHTPRSIHITASSLPLRWRDRADPPEKEAEREKEARKREVVVGGGLGGGGGRGGGGRGGEGVKGGDADPGEHNESAARGCRPPGGGHPEEAQQQLQAPHEVLPGRVRPAGEGAEQGRQTLVRLERRVQRLGFWFWVCGSIDDVGQSVDA